MANENGTVGSNQRRAVIGRRISGGASSSPIVSPALGTTSEPAKSATVSAEPEPIRETPRAQENMASITDYSSDSSSTPAEPRSDAIGDGGAGGGLGQGMNTMQSRNSLNNSFSSGGLNSMDNGPSLKNPYPQQGGLPKQQEYQQPPQGNAYQQGYQQPPQGNAYQQGYQQPPQGNAYQQGYQQPPQGNAYQQGYQQPPQGNAYQQGYQQPPQGNAYQQQAYQQPPQENAYQQNYQQSPPPPEMPVSKPGQMAYSEPAAQPMTRTEREAELPPPSPVPQVTRPVVQREEVVSNPNPTIGSYMASKELDEGDDLYSLLNGMGKESKLEKRKTMKELATGLLGGKKKKPKEV